MISLPFQNNTNFNMGPDDDTQNVLNIQPVWPVSLNEETNLITRTIVPVISQPKLFQGGERENGLGDIQFTAFYSPKKPTSGGLIWGVGPVILMDTATDRVLGTGKWSAGPSIVLLKMTGDWVIGALVQNVWDFAGDDDRESVNQFLMQPFINYNFPHAPGRYLSFSPIITANWEASNEDTWTVPIGGQIGQIFRWGRATDQRFGRCVLQCRKAAVRFRLDASSAVDLSVPERALTATNGADQCLTSEEANRRNDTFAATAS